MNKLKANFEKMELLFSVVDGGIDRKTLNNIINKCFELQKEVIEEADFSNKNDIMITKMSQQIIDMLTLLQKHVIEKEIDDIIASMEK